MNIEELREYVNEMTDKEKAIYGFIRGDNMIEIGFTPYGDTGEMNIQISKNDEKIVMAESDCITIDRYGAMEIAKCLSTICLVILEEEENEEIKKYIYVRGEKMNKSENCKLKENEKLIEINNDFYKYLGYMQALGERGVTDKEEWPWRESLSSLESFCKKLNMKTELEKINHLTPNDKDEIIGVEHKIELKLESLL